jgi:hypothetical protein
MEETHVESSQELNNRVVFRSREGHTTLDAEALRGIIAANGDDVRIQISSSDAAGGLQQVELALRLRNTANLQRQVASADAVAALPTFAWQVHSEGRGVAGTPCGKCLHETPCAICTEDLVTGCQVTSMPCGHLFHATCLRPWLTQHHTCPMCRYKLPIEPPTSPVTDRVRPASSQPAREPGTRSRRSPRHLGIPPGVAEGSSFLSPHRRSSSSPDSSAGDNNDSGGAGARPDTSLRQSSAASAPVLWTSMYRPASASNPATWSLEKLQGVLRSHGVNYEHCHDRSSLVEMCILTLGDYVAAGERYDSQQLRAFSSGDESDGGSSRGEVEGAGAGVIDRSRSILLPHIHAPRHSQSSSGNDASTGSASSAERCSGEDGRRGCGRGEGERVIVTRAPPSRGGRGSIMHFSRFPLSSLLNR